MLHLGASPRRVPSSDAQLINTACSCSKSGWASESTGNMPPVRAGFAHIYRTRRTVHDATVVIYWYSQHGSMCLFNCADLQRNPAGARSTAIVPLTSNLWSSTMLDRRNFLDSTVLYLRTSVLVITPHRTLIFDVNIPSSGD